MSESKLASLEAKFKGHKPPSPEALEISEFWNQLIAQVYDWGPRPFTREEKDRFDELLQAHNPNMWQKLQTAYGDQGDE